MTTHGRKGLKRVIFGSVTEQVVERVKKTPILLVCGTSKPREKLSEYDLT